MSVVPIPTNLWTCLPYPLTPWRSSQNPPSAPQVVDSSDSTWHFVRRYFEASPPPGQTIKEIKDVRHLQTVADFEAFIRRSENQPTPFAPRSSLSVEHQRLSRLRWLKLKHLFSPFTLPTEERETSHLFGKTTILPLWVATSPSPNSSEAPQHSLSEIFRKGVVCTVNAQDALELGGTKDTLILAWVAIGVVA